MDNYQKLLELIGMLARRWHQSTERRFSALGINHTEARLIVVLEKEGGIATQDELSRLLLVDRSNAGRGLKGLEKEGYVIRRKDASDRRTNQIELTKKGHDVVAEISALRADIAKSFFCDLDEGDAAIAAGLLEKALTVQEQNVF